jgi:hypothetical protein
METSHSLMVQSELRVAIRFNTIDIPASPIDRGKRIVNDFATFYLERPFSWHSDFIHLSSDFDSTVSKSTWILCDFNLRERCVQVENVPTQCWQVHYGKNAVP